MKTVLLLILNLLTAFAIASNTETLLLPNSAASNFALFHNKVWISADVDGGVVCYDFKAKELSTVNHGFQRLNTVTDIVVFKNNLYITHKFEGIFVLDSINNSWINCTPKGIAKDSNFFRLSTNKTTLLAGGAGGLLYSTTNGVQWQKVNTDFRLDINTICSTKDGWLIGTSNSGMFKLDLTVKKMERIQNLPIIETLWGFVDVCVYDNKIFASNYAQSIIYSEDEGMSWQILSKQDTIKYIYKFYTSGSHLGAFIPYNGIYRFNGSHFLKEQNLNPPFSFKNGEVMRMTFLLNGVRFFCTNERIVALK